MFAGGELLEAERQAMRALLSAGELPDGRRHALGRGGPLRHHPFLFEFVASGRDIVRTGPMSRSSCNQKSTMEKLNSHRPTSVQEEDSRAALMSAPCSPVSHPVKSRRTNTFMSRGDAATF